MSTAVITAATTAAAMCFTPALLTAAQFYALPSFQGLGIKIFSKVKDAKSSLIP